MKTYIDTCGLPRCRFEDAKIYRDVFGDKIGFEILPMFDMPKFEPNLAANIPFLLEGPVCFHEPVIIGDGKFVEHSAPKGSPEYKAGMYHINLTRKFADILHPSHMVYHINNCKVNPDKKDEMLRISLENLEEIRGMFPDTVILVENTGTDFLGDKLLEQQEFTELCMEKNFDVLIDVGHANANSWDIFRLIDDLKTQIRAFHLHNNDGVRDLHNRLRDGTIDFDALIPYIRAKTPDADLVIEYTRPEYHGEQLMEDIRYLWSRL